MSKEDASIDQRITHHRRCQGCGYDLIGLAHDARCPECGRKIGGVQKPRKEKNPRRSAAQLRRMAFNSKRIEPIVAAMWVVPLLGLVACWFFVAPRWAWIVVSIMTLSGIIQHASTRARRRDYEHRANACDPIDQGDV